MNKSGVALLKVTVCVFVGGGWKVLLGALFPPWKSTACLISFGLHVILVYT